VHARPARLVRTVLPGLVHAVLPGAEASIASNEHRVTTLCSSQNLVQSSLSFHLLRSLHIFNDETSDCGVVVSFKNFLLFHDFASNIIVTHFDENCT
jgi:hypothetical protein